MALSVETIPISHAELAPLSVAEGQLFKAWRQNDGKLCDELVTYADDIVMLENCRERDTPPKLLIIGQDSLCAHVLGTNWQNGMAENANKMPITAQSLVSEGYWQAAKDNEPILDYVTFTAGLRNIGEVAIEYQRLILPFTNRLGIRFMVTVSTPPDPNALDRRLNLRYQSGYSQQTKNRLARG
jgi:hypothetical protein